MPKSGTINETDLHWLAGLLEGEGCFMMRRQHRKDYKNGVCNMARIILKMCDKDIVERAHSLMLGANKVYTQLKKNPKHKTSYEFQIQGRKAEEWMIKLYPLMGQRRKQKIKELLTELGGHNRIMI